MDLTDATQSFGARVGEYQTGRPDYPHAMLADLPAAEATVDLGAGTGKFTRLLARRGKPIVAIEPVASMVARIPHASGIMVVRARAEAVPLASASVDLICAATAFHWFDYAPAVAEIHRVLAGNGHLALIWNVRDDRKPWVAAISALLDRFAGDTERFSTGRWRQILDDPRFRLVATRTYDFAHRMPPHGAVDRVLSTSFIAVLPEAKRRAIAAEADSIVAAAGLSDAAEIDFPYVSQLYLLRRVD
jgi:SAM-dependent methyltransferase